MLLSRGCQRLVCHSIHTRIHHRTITARSWAPGVVMAAASDAPSYHVLQYNYVPDILERRGPFREAHINGAKNLAEQGKIVMAGALADPVDGALFVFKNSTKEEIEAFVKADPYVENGLVPSYTIRPYMVVAP